LQRPILPGGAFVSTIFWICTCNRSILPGVEFAAPPLRDIALATDQFYQVLLCYPTILRDIALANRPILPECAFVPHQFMNSALATDQFYQVLPCCTNHFTDIAVATDSI